jgi:ribokinase
MGVEERDVVVVGGANTDFLVRGPSLPRPGRSVEGDTFQQAPGGKGANQAVAAARLGAAAALVARVGSDDRGDAILSRLADELVDASAVYRDPETETGAVLVMVDASGEKQTMAALGANRNLAVRDVLRAGKLLANARVVLLQLEVPVETVEAAVRLARAAGARVVLDPAPPHELGEELLEGVHVIRCNAVEAEALTGIEVIDRTSARKAAANLMRRGVQAAIIGAPGGNLLLSSDGELWLPHLDVQVVDTTGAGDAFSAALAVCIAKGEDLASAARFANTAAALKTTRLGAQAGLPRREEVLRLLSQSEAAPAPA